MGVPIKYRDKDAIINVMTTLDEKGVIVSIGNYPLSATIVVSTEEAADLAQQIIDVVSNHIQKVAA